MAQITTSFRIDLKLFNHLRERAKIKKVKQSKIINLAIANFLNIDFIQRLKIFELMILSVASNAKNLANVSNNLNQIAFKLNSNENIEIKEIIVNYNDLSVSYKKLRLENAKLLRMLKNIENKKVLKY
jgi:hypothetical protein